MTLEEFEKIRKNSKNKMKKIFIIWGIITIICILLGVCYIYIFKQIFEKLGYRMTFEFYLPFIIMLLLLLPFILIKISKEKKNYRDAVIKYIFSNYPN